MRGKSADKRSTRDDDDVDDDDKDGNDEQDDRCDSGKRATCERRRCRSVNRSSSDIRCGSPIGRSNDAGRRLKRKQMTQRDL